MNRLTRISIALPVRNAGRFIDERIASIRSQTLPAWDVVAVDGFSQDGSWEKLQRWAAHDPRVCCEQQKPEGIYSAINRCIALARGDYLYVATADDTMAPDCLEQLAAALDVHPECGLAHCPLRVISEQGQTVDYGWERASIFVRSSAGLAARAHIRPAPLDGLLHLAGESVYVSLTQLLVRRSLFERVGLFEAQWGSVGDFNWNMRAALAASTIHVPGTWASWRLHGAQATAGAALGSPGHQLRLTSMMEHALASPSARLPAGITKALAMRWRRQLGARQKLRRALRPGTPWRTRLQALAATAEACPQAARDYVIWCLLRSGPWAVDDAALIWRWSRRAGCGEGLRLVDRAASDGAAAVTPA